MVSVSRMKAGQKERWKPLQLLVFFSLLILTEEFAMKSGTEGLEVGDQKSLTPDLLLTLNQDFGSFLGHLEKQTKDRCSLGVSDVSHEFREKLLVTENSGNEKVRQEFSVSPKSVSVSVRSLYSESCESEEDRNTEVKTSGSGSHHEQTLSGLSGSSFTSLMVKAAAGFSPDGKTNTEVQPSFTQGLMIHHLEAGSQTNQVVDQPDSGSWFRTPQSPAAPISQFDHQQILMLQDDDVVRSAAASLYDKHPSLSSLHVLDHNQRPQQVKGQSLPLSENSSLVLVGHGARDASGQMTVSGFTYRDVARILQSCSRMGPHIRTTTVVACEVGSDEAFIENLLKELHQARVQTQLHLWKTVVQVTESGNIISQEASPDGPQWRHQDDTKRVVVTIGRNGEVRRRNGSLSKGETVFTSSTNFLMPPKKDQGKQKTNNQASKTEKNKPNFESCWPEEPTSFIDPEVYKVDQNNLDQQDFRILESLTWGFFHPEPQPERVNNQQVNHNYVIGVKDGNNFKWINELPKQQEVLANCYMIGSGRDIRNIIRHYAKAGETKTTYLMVNNWIFSVEPNDLYVHPAGKRLEGEENQEDIKIIISSCYATQNHEAVESYGDIQGRLSGGEKKSFSHNVKQIFKGETVSNTGLYFHWYFTASVIAESARNFRTFPLTLMALDMDSKHTEDRPDFWFKQHPMARGGSWIDPCRRGFCGSAAPVKEGDLKKLDELLTKEYHVFTKWKETVKENKLKRMTEVAVEYMLLEDTDQAREEFKQNCTNFMNNAKYENVKTSGEQAADCRGQPSTSGGPKSQT